MSWYNYIDNLLVIVGIPIMIYIFWKVRKVDKEMKQRRKELIESYRKGDEEIKRRQLEND